MRGFEDPACGVKRVCNIGQKRNEKRRKEINISLPACPQMRKWRRRDLRGLRGEGRWRGGDLRTRHVREKRSLQRSEKKRKKERKKKTISLLTCPRMRQGRRRDWRGLRGEARGRGGGLRTRQVGRRGRCNTGQERNEK